MSYFANLSHPRHSPHSISSIIVLSFFLSSLPFSFPLFLFLFNEPHCLFLVSFLLFIASFFLFPSSNCLHLLPSFPCLHFPPFISVAFPLSSVAHFPLMTPTSMLISFTLNPILSPLFFSLILYLSPFLPLILPLFAPSSSLFYFPSLAFLSLDPSFPFQFSSHQLLHLPFSLPFSFFLNCISSPVLSL